MSSLTHPRYAAAVRIIQARLAWLPSALARLTLGSVFFQSGWGKLHDLEQVTRYFESLGIPAASLQAPLVAGIEFGGGLLLLLGLATRIAALPLVGVMAAAIATALLPDVESWSDVFGLSEFAYVALLIGLVVSGGGRLSLDAALRRMLSHAD